MTLSEYIKNINTLYKKPEIQHYQKIIVVLVETERVMGEVDGGFEVKAKEQ